MKELRFNKAKEVLAFEVTKLVHGEEKAREALEASRQVFAKGNAASADIPSVEKDGAEFEGEGVGLVSLMKEIGLVSSNSDGFRMIEARRCKAEWRDGYRQEEDNYHG